MCPFEEMQLPAPEYNDPASRTYENIIREVSGTRQELPLYRAQVREDGKWETVVVIENSRFTYYFPIQMPSETFRFLLGRKSYDFEIFVNIKLHLLVRSSFVPTPPFSDHSFKEKSLPLSSEDIDRFMHTREESPTPHLSLLYA